MQVYEQFTVNNAASALASKPLPAIAKHGDSFYEKSLEPNPWTLWAGGTYNDTSVTTFMGGESSGSLTVRARNCDTTGCSQKKVAQANDRNGTLYWSAETTWTEATPKMKVPKAVSVVLNPWPISSGQLAIVLIVLIYLYQGF
jgi:hypothetical protein